MAQMVKVKFLRAHQGKRPGEELEVTKRQAIAWSQDGLVAIVPDEPPIRRAVVTPEEHYETRAPVATRKKRKAKAKAPVKKTKKKKKPK